MHKSNGNRDSFGKRMYYVSHNKLNCFDVNDFEAENPASCMAMSGKEVGNGNHWINHIDVTSHARHRYTIVFVG